jgi:hypothetical protein
MQRVVEPGTFTVLVGSSSQAMPFKGRFELKPSGNLP